LLSIATIPILIFYLNTSLFSLQILLLACIICSAFSPIWAIIIGTSIILSYNIPSLKEKIDAYASLVKVFTKRTPPQSPEKHIGWIGLRKQLFNITSILPINSNNKNYRSYFEKHSLFNVLKSWFILVAIISLTCNIESIRIISFALVIPILGAILSSYPLLTGCGVNYRYLHAFDPLAIFIIFLLALTLQPIIGLLAVILLISLDQYYFYQIIKETGIDNHDNEINTSWKNELEKIIQLLIKYKDQANDDDLTIIPLHHSIGEYVYANLMHYYYVWGILAVGPNYISFDDTVPKGMSTTIVPNEIKKYAPYILIINRSHYKIYKDSIQKILFAGNHFVICK